MENQELQTTRNQSIVTIGDWIITMILMCIPFVNFIMLLVWAFSAGTPVSKANWAKATLIFMLIGFVLVILFWGSHRRTTLKQYVDTRKLQIMILRSSVLISLFEPISYNYRISFFPRLPVDFHEIGMSPSVGLPLFLIQGGFQAVQHHTVIRRGKIKIHIIVALTHARVPVMV